MIHRIDHNFLCKLQLHLRVVFFLGDYLYIIHIESILEIGASSRNDQLDRFKYLAYIFLLLNLHDLV
jgi:hypothetical protein